MNNRSLKPQPEQPKRKANLSLVNFSNSPLALANVAERKLEAIRLLLDQGRAKEAQQLLAPMLTPHKAQRGNAAILAKARCALSLSLEMQGRYRESLEAVAAYETI